MAGSLPPKDRVRYEAYFIIFMPHATAVTTSIIYAISGDVLEVNNILSKGCSLLSLTSLEANDQLNLMMPFHEIGETYRQGTWVSHQLSETRTGIFVDQFALHCCTDLIGNHFLVESLPKMKSAFFMISVSNHTATLIPKRSLSYFGSRFL